MNPGKKSELDFKNVAPSTIPKSKNNSPDLVQSVDLYILDDEGCLKVANGPTISDLKIELDPFNQACYRHRNEHASYAYGVLSLLRCGDAFTPEVEAQSSSGSRTLVQDPSKLSSTHGGPSTSKDKHNPIDLKELGTFFDRCRKPNFRESGLSLKRREPHCYWSCTQHTPQRGINCVKFYYSLVSPNGPALTISHHFHSNSRDENASHDRQNGIDRRPLLSITHEETCSKQSSPISSPPRVDKEKGESKPKGVTSSAQPHLTTGVSLVNDYQEMARGFTTGMKADVLETLLLKMSELKTVSEPYQVQNGGITFQPVLHPKAILLGVLEAFESDLRSRISNQQKFMSFQEEQIKEQRKSENKKGDGLIRCRGYIGDRNVELGLLRPKTHYLTSCLAALESCKGIPESTEDLAFLFSASTVGDVVVSKHKNPFEDHWARQLNEINARLLDLNGKCDRCKADLKTLQLRVTGNLMMLSNLIQQRENEYQVKILLNQEIIAKRTKLDGTITKWIAILTAFLLPGTFVAILFTVPMFNWDAEDEVWAKPKPFKLYWEITGPITGALVASFLLWFSVLELRHSNGKPDNEGEDTSATADGQNGSIGAVGIRRKKLRFQAMFTRRRRSNSQELPTV